MSLGHLLLAVTFAAAVAMVAWTARIGAGGEGS